MPITTTIASAAAKNCSLVCARQSASAVSVRVVATIRIGKCISELDRADLVLRQPRAGEASGHVAVQRQRALK